MLCFTVPGLCWVSELVLCWTETPVDSLLENTHTHTLHLVQYKSHDRISSSDCLCINYTWALGLGRETRPVVFVGLKGTFDLELQITSHIWANLSASWSIPTQHSLKTLTWQTRPLPPPDLMKLPVSSLCLLIGSLTVFSCGSVLQRASRFPRLRLSSLVLRWF